MAANASIPVKQCVADPALHWLRECVKGARPALDQMNVKTLIEHGLGPLAARMDVVADRAGLDLLAQTARAMAMRALAHRQAMTRLDRACVAAEINVLVIKGEAVAGSLYDDGAVRTRSDIDLWVTSSQLVALRGVLESLGFPSVRSISQQWARFEVVHGGGTAAEVGFDLHVQPFFRPRMLTQRPFADVWRDSTAIAGLDGMRAPNAFDGFLIAALHLAKNPLKRWIWLYDIDRFCVKTPEAVRRACNMAAEWGVASLVADALCRSAMVFGTALPCALPLPTGPEPFASMLKPRGKLHSLWRDLSALPDLAARLTFIRELLRKL